MNTFAQEVAAFKKALIEQRIKESGGCKTCAAQSLGIQRSHLHKVFKRVGCSTPDAVVSGHPCPNKRRT